MKKTINLQDLDCANCAAKMESAIAKLPGVDSVRVSFMSQRMVLEARDDLFDEVLAAAKRTAKKIGPDLVFLT